MKNFGWDEYYVEEEYLMNSILEGTDELFEKEIWMDVKKQIKKEYSKKS